MGSSQSQEAPGEAETLPKTVRIDRSEIPEEYKTVGVSNEVVDRVLSMHGGEGSLEVEKIKQQLEEERQLNEKLRKQMQQLTDLHHSSVNSGPGISLDEMEERKRVFNETVERVEKQFFSYQRENACESNEKDIMECISKNKSRVLNCMPLVNGYQKCVSDFREQVLAEVTKA